MFYLINIYFLLYCHTYRVNNRFNSLCTRLKRNEINGYTSNREKIQINFLLIYSNIFKLSMEKYGVKVKIIITEFKNFQESKNKNLRKTFFWGIIMQKIQNSKKVLYTCIIISQLNLKFHSLYWVVSYNDYLLSFIKHEKVYILNFYLIVYIIKYKINYIK